MKNQKIFNYMMDLVNNSEISFDETDFMSEKRIKERMNIYTDENGKLDQHNLLRYLQNEIKDQTAVRLAHVLTNLVDEGLINSPINDDRQ